MKRRAIHPLAELLPEASEVDVAALATDIQTRGLITPILLFEGKVLDGRTRLRACELVGVDPRFDEYKGDDPVGAIASLNLRARNLNESQRALLAARIIERWLAAPPSANWHLKNGDKATMAAALTNVSRRSVLRAKGLLDVAPADVVEKVFRGEVAVSRALASAKPEGASAKRKPSCEKLALRLTRQLDALEAALREACADRVLRVMLEERLQDASRNLYALVDGSAYAGGEHA